MIYNSTKANPQRPNAEAKGNNKERGSEIAVLFEIRCETIFLTLSAFNRLMYGVYLIHFIDVGLELSST
jgi:hypothetical protein